MEAVRQERIGPVHGEAHARIENALLRHTVSTLCGLSPTQLASKLPRTRGSIVMPSSLRDDRNVYGLLGCESEEEFSSVPIPIVPLV